MMGRCSTIDELKKQKEESDNAKKTEKASRLWNGDEEAKKTAIELYREVAINSYVPAMEFMAWICHDDRDGFKTVFFAEKC